MFGCRVFVGLAVSVLLLAVFHSSVRADESHAEIFAENIYPSAVTCADCHPKHYKEWSVSQHAYAQMSPIFMAMQMRINTLTSSTNGDFCIRCHNQVGMNLEESPFISNLDRPASSREGITCSVCHRVSKSYGKISGRLPLVRGPMQSTIFGPSGSKALQEVIEDPENKGYKVTTDPGERGLLIHAKTEPFFELTQPGFCGTCHDVTLLNGFRLEEAFSEFKQTAAAADGVTCQDCHMGKEPGKVSGYDFGPAAIVNGIETAPRKVTNHFFAGPDYSLIHPAIFPHNPKAAKFADLRQWLQFDWKAGWGEVHFEDAAEPAVDAMYELQDLLEDMEGGELPGRDDLSEQLAAFEDLVAYYNSDEQKGAYERFRRRIDALYRDEATSGDAETVVALKQSFEDFIKAVNLDFPEFWEDPGDREDAREFLEEQFERLDWAKLQREEILRAGYLLGDLSVASASTDGLSFSVDVKNGTNGHGVPTGFDAERLVYLRVTVTDGAGAVVYKSGDTDPNGDLRDNHSLFVQQGLLPIDEDLFNLQSKFIVRMVRGGEREQILAVNTSVDALPFVRPETRATVLFGRPLGARKHKKTIEPLGSRTARYTVDGGKLVSGEKYSIKVELIAQMIPVHLISAIQESGFDYSMSPKELAEGVVGGASVLWTKKTDLTVQ